MLFWFSCFATPSNSINQQMQLVFHRTAGVSQNGWCLTERVDRGLFMAPHHQPHRRWGLLGERNPRAPKEFVHFFRKKCLNKLGKQWTINKEEAPKEFVLTIGKSPGFLRLGELVYFLKITAAFGCGASCDFAMSPPRRSHRDGQIFGCWFLLVVNHHGYHCWPSFNVINYIDNNQPE